MPQQRKFAAQSRTGANLISVLDYGFDAERQPYFTMDLLPAAQTILAVAAETDQAARVDLIVQVLQALSYLHRRGVVHRDLKPSSRRAEAKAWVVLPRPAKSGAWPALRPQDLCGIESLYESTRWPETAAHKILPWSV